MQVDQVKERSIDECLDRNARLTEQSEGNENVERSTAEEHNVVEEGPCEPWVNCCVHGSDLLLDVFVIEPVSKALPRHDEVEDNRHYIEEGDNADAWQDLDEG